MRVMIAVLVSFIVGLLASCSGGVQTDVIDDAHQIAETTDAPVIHPDDIWYANGDEDEIE